MRPLLMAAGLLVAAGLACAQEREAAPAAERPLRVGDRAPSFALNNQDGKVVRSSDYQGEKWIALAFFPKANTGG